MFSEIIYISLLGVTVLFGAAALYVLNKNGNGKSDNDFIGLVMMIASVGSGLVGAAIGRWTKGVRRKKKPVPAVTDSVKDPERVDEA